MSLRSGMSASDRKKEEEFKVIMTVMGEWLDKNEPIHKLKVLYKDHIFCAGDLDRAATTKELFRYMVATGVLSEDDFGILYDTINITEQYELQTVINEKVSSFPMAKGRKLSEFTEPHRKKIMDFGKVLSAEDVVKINGLFNHPLREYVDCWDMIMDLEHRLILDETTMNEFVARLKTIDVPHAVKVLKGDDDTVVFHLSVTDPNALENLWQISQSGELVRDLAELLVPEGMRDDFASKWTTEVNPSQYESALKKLKTSDTRDPYDVCIISDDSTWETKLKDSLKKRRRKLNTTCMKKWRLRNPNGLQELIKQSKKVVVAFSAKPLTEYSKYSAHCVIVEMLEAKTLTDASIIAAKVSEDAVVPEEFKSFNVVNGWEDDFIDRVLQDFPEGSGTS